MYQTQVSRSVLSRAEEDKLLANPKFKSWANQLDNQAEIFKRSPGAKKLAEELIANRKIPVALYTHGA